MEIWYICYYSYNSCTPSACFKQIYAFKLVVTTCHLSVTPVGSQNRGVFKAE
jgi:hypothetical protein